MAEGQERVRVFITDQIGNKQREVRISAHTEIVQLLPAIVTAFGLPTTDPSGRQVTYRLAFGNQELSRETTLAGAEVPEGASLTIVTELVAAVGDRL
jgi:WXG100 protein secretion system (Wss), protein YukD